MPTSQQHKSTRLSRSTNVHRLDIEDGEDASTGSRIPFASKGKWKDQGNHGFSDVDGAYLGPPLRARADITSTSRGAEHDLRSMYTSSSLSRSKQQTYARDSGSQVNAIRHSILPRNSLHSKGLQRIHDRPPPPPPSLPERLMFPWYLIYAPEVTLPRLDTKDNADLRQDIDHLSEVSQGRTSASGATPTSASAASRTPSKTRMKMVPSGQRDSSRPRRLAVDSGENAFDRSRPDARGRSTSFEGDASDTTAEVSSTSSSESDSDSDETDGTDSEVEELLEFKRATRRLGEVRYPDAQAASPATLLHIPCKKRKLFMEENLPSTYGSRYTLGLARLAEVKSGTWPRAVARKSFARAIGSRLLARKQQDARV